jgi:hypothetical protein
MRSAAFLFDDFEYFELRFGRRLHAENDELAAKQQ